MCNWQWKTIKDLKEEKAALEKAYDFERGTVDDMRRLGFAMAAKLPPRSPEVMEWLSAVQDCHP